MAEKKLKNSEIVTLLRSNPQKNIELLKSLESNNKKAKILNSLSDKTKASVANLLSDQDLIEMLVHLDPDQATDVVQLLSGKRQNKVIAELDEQSRNTIEILLKFPADVAAGLMKVNYIQVDLDETVAEVGEKFKEHEKRTGRLPEIILMDDGKLAGYVPGHVLGLSYPTDKIGQYAKKAIKINSDAKQKEVLNTFKNTPHGKVIVVGPDESVLGVIYSDDVLKLLTGKESASLYSFAGLQEEESVFDNYAMKTKMRYKWLIINLFTSFLAAFTVSIFNDTIAKYVLLAVYMPIVAGMGGNAATQTLAIMVRGISLNQVSFINIFRIVRQELGAALLNGLINGVIVAAIVIIFNRDVKLAIVLSFAMIINLIVAAFFGSLIPVIMKRLGKDPATSATIFITTATDVLGFMAFLGLATIILG